MVKNAKSGQIFKHCVSGLIFQSGWSFQTLIFFSGALSDMPAVRAFALYAGMALLIDFFMQITCFVSLIALDMARQENNRFDVLCCFQGSKKDHR